MHPAYVRMSNEINIPNVKFVICGNIEEESLPQQVKNLNPHHKFEFRGYVDNIGEIMLCQIPGVSSASALAILAQFKTLPNLGL